MHILSIRWACRLLAVGLAVALAGVCRTDAQTKETPSGAAAIRKALDQKITLDFAGQSLQDAVEHLRKKTKLNFVIDMQALYMPQWMGGGLPPGAGGAATLYGGIGGLPGGGAGLPGFPGAPATPGMDPPPTTLKSDNGKVRTALQNMLNQHNLTYVVLSDTVLITTEDLGFYRQMRQRVNVDVADKSLAEILKQLSDETGVNLVLDPRQADKAKGKIAIQLDDVTLDTALKLLTELADLSAVRVGSVVFVTSEARAEKLRKDNAPGRNPDSPYGPNVIPGFSGRGMPGIIGGGFGAAVPPPATDLPPPAQKKR